MAYDKYDHSNVMDAFFRGKIGIDDLPNRPKSKIVELGHGKGVEHAHGTYSQYTKKLREQTIKGNTTISIGKSVIEKDTFSMSDLTDKFVAGDIPHILVTYYNVINTVTIKVLWKDPEDEVISEQYYEIPAAHSLNYDWWDQYGTYFIGPEDLEEGNYKADIILTEFGRGDKTKTFTTSLDFTVTELSEKDP